MNASLRAALVSVAALGLAACSSMHEKSTYVPPASMSGSQQVSIQQDAEYMAIVERIARRRGITLEWVNPPSKRVVASN